MRRSDSVLCLLLAMTPACRTSLRRILYIHGNFEVLSILTDIIENLDCSDEKSLKEGYEQIRSTLSELKRKIKRELLSQLKVVHRQ